MITTGAKCHYRWDDDLPDQSHWHACRSHADGRHHWVTLQRDAAVRRSPALINSQRWLCWAHAYSMLCISVGFPSCNKINPLLAKGQLLHRVTGELHKHVLRCRQNVDVLFFCRTCIGNGCFLRVRVAGGLDVQISPSFIR